MSCKCHGADDGSGRIDYQYAVKIICGIIKVSQQSPNPLPPGRYSTATNVHNPSRCDTVILRWKVAIGLPGLKVGPVTTFAEASLGPDEALEIDCSDVMARLKRDGVPLPPYVKGWVIIECSAQLDVVAVYGTSALAGEPMINTFHTERVEPRCLPVCDDFVLDISTGVADWYVKGPATGSAFDQATLSSPVSPWAQPPSGSRWVVPGTLTSDGDYIYRLQFKLCSGFRNPNLKLQLLADYFANVFLNGHQIPPVQTAAGGPNFTTAIGFATNSHFKAGDNELTVVVTNTERLSQTGLALQGMIEIANGLCAGAPYPLLTCPEVRYSLATREVWFNSLIGMVISRNPWIDYGANGTPAGNTNGYRRAERFEAQLLGTIPPGTSIEYRVFTRNLIGGLVGWSPWTSSGFAGASGTDKPITGLEIRLVNSPVNCHVRYRVATRPRLALYYYNAVQWQSHVMDGATAGTAGGGPAYPPIVAVEVQIV